MRINGTLTKAGIQSIIPLALWVADSIINVATTLASESTPVECNTEDIDFEIVDPKQLDIKYCPVCDRVNPDDIRHCQLYECYFNQKIRSHGTK